MSSPPHRVRITSARPVGGGCISPAARVELEGGETYFLKWSRSDGEPRGLLEAEAKSLEAMRSVGVVRVPSVIATGGSWLLLEWLEPGRASPRTWRQLGGAAAAQLHGARAARFGWSTDNFIGRLAQANGWLDSWPEFWRIRRLEPQLHEAARLGHFSSEDRSRFNQLLDRLDSALLAVASADGASLLHGDLWSGNVHVCADGSAALVDPASYYGHREVDLAMAELFGGFGVEFFDSYRDAWPLAEGYCEARRPIYQLYYLLVHVNLFGRSYVAAARTARDAALAAVST